jgi:hypothetical protein
VSRPTLDGIYQMDDRDTKRRLQLSIGTMSGLYEIIAEPRREPRNQSEAQRRYFHGVVIRELYNFLNDPAGGAGDGRAHYTRDQCKDLIVAKVMGLVDVVNPVTGEIIDQTRPSTAGYGLEEYSKLIDGAVKWLDEAFGIQVPPPELYYQTEGTHA